MNARGTVFLGSALAALFVAQVQADTGPSKLSDSTFQDWNGSLIQFNLNDGSVLNEYVAKTLAGSAEDAFLAVSFLPRFNCTPIISVSVSSTSGIEFDNSEVTIKLMIDQQPIDFPVIFDTKNSLSRYTFNANQAQNLKLLSSLDSSSRVSLNWFDAESEAALPANGGDSDPQAQVERDLTGNQIEFSLLGSKRSTQAVKAHCHAHKPIPFEN